jgi:SEC-C motif-containing protein
MSELCPCQSELNYDACCGPYIEGTSLPETALQLMRSRYTAFATQKIDYIVATTHPKSSNDLDEQEIANWSKKSEWLGFEVINTENGEADDTGGIVEFIARYNLDGKEQEHHEVSLFQKEKNKWYFVNGDPVTVDTYVRETPKVGRNEPCPCGSGKKFKKCCG